MLYASILCDERPLFAAADAVANIARHIAGRSLFAQSKRLILSVQQRAKADPAHAAILDHLRTARRFDGLVIRYLRDHVLSPADIERDPTWLLAPTLVATNSDRIRINILKLAVLAVKTSKPIVQWDRCIAGGRLSPAAQMLLKVRAESLLTGHFVEGAPAMITVNSDKDAGLVNGALCSFKRLIFESHDDEQAYNDALVREAALRCDLDPSSSSSSDHGGLLIKLPKPPAAIVVTLWRSGRDFTISADTADGEVNLNVTSNAAAGDDHDGGDGGDGDNDDGDGDTKAKSKGKGKGKAKARRQAAGRQTKFKYSTHKVEPALALTYHKVQGCTFDKVVCCIRRASGRTTTFEALYVGLSRVTSGAGLRIISDDSDIAKTLGGLAVNPDYDVWLRSYIPDPHCVISDSADHDSGIIEVFDRSVVDAAKSRCHRWSVRGRRRSGCEEGEESCWQRQRPSDDAEEAGEGVIECFTLDG